MLRAYRVGIAGPVGSGKTALVDQLSKRLWPAVNLGVVTNDIYTKEDAEFLTRRVTLAGITRHPTADWMVQMARNAVDEETGHLRGQRYLLHDRDTKFCPAFRNVLKSAGVRPVVLPPQSPNLNAFAERWVRSVKQECLSKLILFGETSLRRALTEYVAHFHGERNHQGKQNQILFSPVRGRSTRKGRVRCNERLGGLLKYYSRAA